MKWYMMVENWSRGNIVIINVSIWVQSSIHDTN